MNKEIKLSVNNLKVSFRTDAGKVQAVDPGTDHELRHIPDLLKIQISLQVKAGDRCGDHTLDLGNIKICHINRSVSVNSGWYQYTARGKKST